MALPEAEIVRQYLQRDLSGNWVHTLDTLAFTYGVSQMPIRRIVKKAGAMRTPWETRRWRPNSAMREAADRGKTPLTGRTAINCRMDPAWEARQKIVDVVYCRECLLPFNRIWLDEKRKGHIWAAHKLTVENYIIKWPGVRLRSFGSQAKDAHKSGRQSDLNKIMAACAAKYLIPGELSACRLDIHWEQNQKNLEFWRKHVACRDCGFIARRSLTLHLRQRHRWDRPQYHRLYPDAPTTSAAAVEGLRRLFSSPEAAVAAWRKEVDRLTHELKQANAELAKAEAGQKAARRKTYTPEEITNAIDLARRMPTVRHRTAMVALNLSESEFYRWIDAGRLKKYRKGEVYSAQIIQILDRGLADRKT